jgi:Fe-S cluster biogenesis protein NfuA
MQHYLTGLPVLEDGAAPQKKAAPQDEDVISSQIRELIETRVQPAVAQDGGHIDFVKFEDGVAYLHMQGACAGCPSSSLTLKSGIETMLKHYVPEVLSVEAIDA